MAAPDRLGQDRRRRARGRARAGRGRQGLLHDADQGAVEPEVRRSAPAGTAPDSVGLLTGDNSINGDAPVVVMTTEVLRNMIYARSPRADGPALRRARRGPLPAGRVPRPGVGGGDHPPAARRCARVPVGHRVERRGAGRLDHDRAWPDRDGARGAPSGRAAQPLPRRRPPERAAAPPARRWSTAGPTPRPSRSTPRGPPAPRPPRGHRRPRRRFFTPRRLEVIDRCSTTTTCCPRSTSSSAASACDDAVAALPRRRAAPHRRPTSAPHPRHRRRAHRGADRRRPRRARLRPLARRLSRRASPPTTRAWCRRSRRRSRCASSRDWSRPCSPPRRSRSASTCRPARW